MDATLIPGVFPKGLNDPSYEELVDGFTFQGGDVQLYYEIESLQNFGRMRVSNCVFDMLDYANAHQLVAGEAAGVDGPDFGILLVHTFDFELVDGEPGPPVVLPLDFADVSLTETTDAGYWDIFLGVYGSTFIQGWLGESEGQTVTFASCTPDAVAIADVANTLRNDNELVAGTQVGGEMIVPDTNRTYRGVGSLNLQNNLIRRVSVPGQLPSSGNGFALLGVDNSDVSTAVGAATNAFDPDRTGSSDISPLGPYESVVLGSNPIPVTSPVPGTPTPSTDPGFVGEFLQRSKGVPVARSRDWRLLPGSGMANLGTRPVVGNSGFAEVQAANGAKYVRRDPNFQSWAFLFDGEGYGNLRALGGNPDLGADEIGLLILAGAARNDTQVWGDENVNADHAHDCGATGIDRQRYIITGNSASVELYATIGYDLLEQTGVSPLAWDLPPGAKLPPTVVGNSGLIWINEQPDPISLITTMIFMSGCSNGQRVVIPRTVATTTALPTAYMPPLVVSAAEALSFSTGTDSSRLTLQSGDSETGQCGPVVDIPWGFFLLGEQAFVNDGSSILLSNAQWSYERSNTGPLVE